MEAPDKIRRILDLARWAPSGDNTQPWRFEILTDDTIRIHCTDTQSHCVYDFRGHPTHIAVGALIENIAIAASLEKLTIAVELMPVADPRRLTFSLEFQWVQDLVPDDLAASIPKRSVQRRPLSRKALSPMEADSIRGSVGPGYSLKLFEGTKRTDVARILWSSARLRLTIPEAYEVHKSVIAWHSQFSEDRVPDQAIGLDPIGVLLMRWVMASWNRVQFFNTFLGGTLLPRLQLDLLPGLFCASHFALVAERAPQSILDYVQAGRAMQRLWLTCTQLGLQFQPEMTPLIFSWYAATRDPFSTRTGADREASEIRRQFAALVDPELESRIVFFGRIGHGNPATARSLRLPLDSLILKDARV